jgi:hypothetical protein
LNLGRSRIIKFTFKCDRISSYINDYNTQITIFDILPLYNFLPAVDDNCFAIGFHAWRSINQWVSKKLDSKIRRPFEFVIDQQRYIWKHAQCPDSFLSKLIFCLFWIEKVHLV